MAMFKSVSELCDVVSLGIFCPEDASFMLTLEDNVNEYWIPSSKIQTGCAWEVQAAKDTKDIFGEMASISKIVRIVKICIPNLPPNSIYNCIYQVNVDSAKKKKSKITYGRYRGKVRWVSETELMRLSSQENLKSPELIEIFFLLKGATFDTNSLLPENVDIALPNEYVYHGTLVEINERTFVAPGATIYEQIVEAANFNQEIQKVLFGEFMIMCFPATCMGAKVFTRFAIELGWPKEEIPYLYRSADMSGRGGLSFRDFIYFLAAIEPGTSHGGGPAELRCRYIFRYFDRDRDNLLSFNEYKVMIMHLRKSKKQPLDAVSVIREAESSFKIIGQTSDRALTIADFLRAVGDLKLRGTSQIYRSPVSIIKYTKDLQDQEMKNQINVKPKQKIAEQKTITPGEPIVRKNYTSYLLASHTVKLQRSGTMINVDQIFNMDGVSVTHSSTNLPNISELTKKRSDDQFSQKSVSNELLKSLRYLTQINKNKPGSKKGTSNQFTWGQLDSNQYSKTLTTVCNQVTELLKTESRLVELFSPVYCMGDLHGNFSDLLYFEKVLWHLGPGLCPSNLLFLGDYVDRGAYSIEVISYLFSYKIQSPNKVTLLRGNHEVRDIQKMFTFQRECINKFGERVGLELWDVVNSAFDCMPVAATIDGKIFCCHGGIPPPWLCPVASAINSIPFPLSRPDEQSALAWEIMWNDPVKQNQLSEAMVMELMANEGFANNFKRGTAHVFSVDALERFLNINNFSHIIRAHEVVQAGFNVQLRGKLLTVFSSSKYCGGQNEAACILADQGKLRILRLEIG